MYTFALIIDKLRLGEVIVTLNQKKHRLSLPQLLTFGFLGIILIGSALLSLPIATDTVTGTDYVDALFTATSATCITGLTTISTAAHWSVFGQIVIMILVEIGGLGYMTFTVLLFSMIRKRPTLTTRMMVKQSLSLETLADVKTVTKYVIGLSIVIQTAGVFLLMVDLVPRFGLLKGAYFSLFHSVMGFCNAGFDLFGDSLASFANDPYVILVISMLIVAGGVGFLVWRDLLLWRRRHRVSLHTKISLTTSTVLTVSATLILWFSEHGFRALGSHVNLWSRMVDTFLLAVSPRTAGLQVLSYSHISMAGIILTMVLMFIGGTPGSTAGGIKTTTLGILWMQSWAALRGQEDVEFGHRRFSQENIYRASMLVFISAMIVIIAVMLLSISEPIPKGQGLEYILFEVLSAFSTTGLSMGLTPHLTLFGKSIIMVLMFIGRVGLFTVMYTILNANRRQRHYRYVEEGVMIG